MKNNYLPMFFCETKIKNLYKQKRFYIRETNSAAFLCNT